MSVGDKVQAEKPRSISYDPVALHGLVVSLTHKFLKRTLSSCGPRQTKTSS
jgi:hypothetical protein